MNLLQKPVCLCAVVIQVQLQSIKESRTFLLLLFGVFRPVVLAIQSSFISFLFNMPVLLFLFPEISPFFFFFQLLSPLFCVA